jgi:hypothetical protein
MKEAARIELTDEQVHGFAAQGFLSIGRLTTEEELAWLRDVHDAILKRKLGYTPDELATLRIIDKCAITALATVFSPERIEPTLTSTLFFSRVRQVVSRLLNVEETQLSSEWRLVCKLAHGGETPWHQDALYRQSATHGPLPHVGATVWMPLDPATSESGCLQYISGSHFAGVRPHYFRDGHVMTDDVDPSQAVERPVAAGEALVHHCRTLHYAGPNRTERPRRAVQVLCRITHESVGQ